MTSIPPFSRVDGRITAVYLNDAKQGSEPIRGRAELVTYDATFVRVGKLVKKEKFTPYNRRYTKTSIISARVGDYCDVQINRASGDTQVYVHTERDDLRDCDGNPVEDL
jgi:hypothetical protein